MGKNRIEAKIEEFDIHLTKRPDDNEFDVSGKVNVSFSCPSCYIKNIIKFIYGKDEMTREHKCEICSEEYLVTLEGNYSFKARVEDVEGIRLHRQMKPIIDEFKKRKFDYFNY